MYYNWRLTFTVSDRNGKVLGDVLYDGFSKTGLSKKDTVAAIIKAIEDDILKQNIYCVTLNSSLSWIGLEKGKCTYLPKGKGGIVKARYKRINNKLFRA